MDDAGGPIVGESERPSKRRTAPKQLWLKQNDGKSPLYLGKNTNDVPRPTSVFAVLF